MITPEQTRPFSCGGAPLKECLTFDASVEQGIVDLANAMSLYPDATKYVLGYSQSTQIQTITKRAIMLNAQTAGGQ